MLRAGRFSACGHKLAAVDVDDLEITMPPAGGIAGRVVDGSTGLAVESFRVRFVDPELAPGEERLWGYGASWSREGWLFENSDGTWDTGEETDLVPGLVIGVEVRAAGYAPALAGHVVIAKEPKSDALVHRLYPGVALSGVVVEAKDGAPVEEALVKLYRAGEPIHLHDSEDTHGRALRRTDSAGSFRFENVAPGEHRLLVQHGAHPDHLDGPFTVNADDDVDRVIELPACASVTGILRDIEGRPRGAVEIELAPEGGDGGGIFREWKTTTEPDGRFLFEGLHAGSFRIGPQVVESELTVKEYTLPFVLSAGETRELDLAPQGTAMLVGRIEHDGTLPELLPVSLVGVGGDSVSEGARRAHFGGLARNGVFHLRGLSAGTYEVFVTWQDFSTRTMWSSPERKQVTLVEGATSEVWIEVEGSAR